jgi:hypothetical protein
MNYIHCTEPYLTAADAIAAAREAAIALRYQLPLLLGSRLAPTYRMLADRFERGVVLDPFSRNALATVLAECDLAIGRGSSRHWVLHETGWGPDGSRYTPELTLVRTPEAEELFRIRKLLQRVQDRADRTIDLIAGESAVRDVRT